MSNDAIFMLMGVVLGIFAVVVIAFLFIRKRMQSSDVARIERLRKEAIGGVIKYIKLGN